MRIEKVTPVRLALGIAAGVVALDHVTKFWAQKALDDGPIEVLGTFLQFRLVYNPGAAFGTLTSGGRWLAFLAAVVSIGMIYAITRVRGRQDAVLFGLILGGALGNLLDRLFRAEGFADGEVVDWIDFNFWPTFNVADSSISIGVVLAVMMALRAERSAAPE